MAIEIHATDPRWFATAKKLFGIREVPGPKHDSRILGWLKKLGAWWADDETPWCGVFVAYCMQANGIAFPKAYYRAKEWESWGSLLRRDRLAPGAVLVFHRSGGGHVGFYVGEDRNHYYVLGGNQSNAVNVVKIAKTRLTASRWPTGEPVIGKPNLIDLKVDTTTNEA
jgi:uncharacterized protein (TIGR02594 family)